jgi:hypothetical protein
MRPPESQVERNARLVHSWTIREAGRADLTPAAFEAWLTIKLAEMNEAPPRALTILGTWRGCPLERIYKDFTVLEVPELCQANSVPEAIFEEWLASSFIEHSIDAAGAGEDKKAVESISAGKAILVVRQDDGFFQLRLFCATEEFDAEYKLRAAASAARARRAKARTTRAGHNAPAAVGA